MAEKVELIIEVKGGDSVGKASEKVLSLRTELFRLKEQLAKGGLEGQEFRDAQLRAAELENKIRDVNRTTKALSQDFKLLGGAVSIASGITAGFTAAQGAMALFGSENEDLQKTLIKVQGATALLNGLQGIQLALQKESAAMTAIQSARLQVLTFLQTRYTAAVGGTTGAMRLLRIAGAALGIGLIIGAIALLVSNFDKLKTTIGKFLPSLDSIVKGFKAAYNAVTDFLGVTSDQTRVYDRLKASTDQRSKEINREIELLEAQGGKEREIFQKRLTLIDNELRVLKAKRDAKKALSEEELENEKDLNNQRAIEVAKYNKAIDDEIDKDNKEKQEKAKEQAEKDRKFKEDVAAKIAEQDERDAEQERELEEYNVEKREEIRAIDTENIRKDNEKRLFQLGEYNRAVIDAEQSVVDAKRNALEAGFNIAQQFTGKNKTLADTLFAIQKGVAIAQIIIDTQKEIAGYYSNPTWKLLPDGGLSLATTASAGAKIRAATSIASIGATTIGKFMGGAGGNVGGGGGGTSLPTNSAPNIRGFQTGSTGRQNGQGGSMKVYVTETDIRKSTNKTNSIYYQATVD